MVRTKVFVGNLDFQTKESELAKQFSTAGKVISANIITRGPRSLGYGFVEMESEEDAQKAVQAMNKKEVDGRPINVEVAKPRAEEGQETENKQQEGSGRGGFRGRGGRGGFRGTRGGSRGGARGGATQTFQPRGGFRGGRGAARGGAQSFKPRNNGGTNPSKEEEEEDKRTPSKTTLFVANLPFKLDDESFGKILKDANLAYKTAHVVRNTRSQRSKGFGFIEFENEQDQQNALAALNNKTVEERQLVVKVALTELKTEEAPAQTKQ